MSHLFSLPLVLLLFAPQGQNWPAAFQKLPEDVRAKATLVFTSTYGQGRGPHLLMPDGTRRWLLDSWFQIKKVYRGQAGGKYIYVNSAVSRKTDAGVKLEVGREYLVLLRPSEKSMKAIKAGKYVSAWDALDNDEIIAIVELK
jgi:hypothetical protein